jgi:tetratricopeptide (TPR) repeat protein
VTGPTGVNRRSLLRGRLLLLVLAAAVAATATLFGGVLSEAPASDGEGASVAAPIFGTAPAAASSPARDTATEVHRLQTILRGNRDDADSLTMLGLAYEQRARETGDPSYYSRADGVLHEALALAPRSPLVQSGLGSLALARHRFRGALLLGRRAVALGMSTGAPRALQSRSWGVVGDALVELGRYGAAFGAFDRMMRLEPGLAAYARVSYARELLGHREAALAPMRAAVDSSDGEPEPLAWTSVQLGKLYWSLGRIGEARAQYLRALHALPGYVYALDALAQVEAARGRSAAAVTLERRAVATAPLPQFVAALGDLLAVSGRRAEAQRQYALMGAIRRLLAANGVKTDLEIALFQTDHRIRLHESLALARAGRRDRPSIDGDDVLAWALARNGRCAEALPYSRQALRLGTRDPLKFFHRGMIERCLGHPAEAQAWFRSALALNPHFSILWSPVARRYAR